MYLTKEQLERLNKPLTATAQLSLSDPSPPRILNAIKHSIDHIQEEVNRLNRWVAVWEQLLDDESA